MIGHESRYVEADREFVVVHAYGDQGSVDLDEDGEVLEVVREATYLVTIPPIPVPETQYMVKDGEDIQHLAGKYMGDPRRWWQIADLNPQVRYPLDVKMADTIYLPD